jgi:integrase
MKTDCEWCNCVRHGHDSSIRNGEIYLHTTNNWKPGKACTPRAAIRARHPAGAATRTFSAVFMASGVAGACSHRFRHTLATEVLELGGTFRKAADILGDTEAIVRKHYAKWSRLRQERISVLMRSLCNQLKTSG